MHTTDHPGKAESDVRGVYKTLERDPERYSVGCGEGSHLRALVDAGIAVCDEKSCQFKNKDRKKRMNIPPGLMDWSILSLTMKVKPVIWSMRTGHWQ